MNKVESEISRKNMKSFFLERIRLNEIKYNKNIIEENEKIIKEKLIQNPSSIKNIIDSKLLLQIGNYYKRHNQVSSALFYFDLNFDSGKIWGSKIGCVYGYI